MYINIAKIDFGKCYRGESPGPVEEYYGMYVTPADASAINVTPNDSYYTLHGKYLKCSLNGKTWNDWNSSVTIEPGQKLYIKGEDDYVWNSSTSGKLITSNGYYNVGGDISSLTNEIVEVKEYTFYNLFLNDSYIKDASSLILPATTLADWCYSSMFKGCTALTTAPELHAITLTYECYKNMFNGCTSLTTAPELPATTLKQYCYSGMFSGCTSLNVAPELPATTLKQYCYSNMFNGCTSLTTAPELPATTLANGCYGNMLAGCKSLTTAPSLAATTLANYCYQSMFQGCTSLTTAPELPATTLAPNCYRTMFNGCTSLTTAPELPATTLADYCYADMFYNCTSLNTAPELPATTLENGCYNSMFNGCTSLTTAPVLNATTLVLNCYNSMFRSCFKLNSITMLATDISASNCLLNWVSDVAPTGTFMKAQSMTSLPIGVNGIPEGWTVADYTDYMTLSALGDGEITITIPAALNSSYATSLSYSKDKSTWNETIIDDTAQTISIPVTSGENVYLKGIAKQLGVVGNGVNIISSADINASGNIMSLLYGDDYKDKVELPSGSSSTFAGLFSGNTHLINAKDLIIPTTTLSTKCYQEMFAGCTALTTVPELPATTLASYCYYNMFKDCKSLTTAPELPVTTLADYCYSGMFQGCTSLTTAPELIATTLTKECYAYMFQGCSSLTTAPELPATTLAIRCYEWMFAKCSSLTTGPVLHVLTLTPGCYQSMFEDCTSLNNITMLATDISASDCLMHWVVGVASTGTFTKSPEMTSLPTGINGIPEGWTVVDYGAAVDYSQEYFTITALGDGNITLHLLGPITNYMDSLSYSKDKSSWNDVMLMGPELVITVISGDNVYFKGHGRSMFWNDSTEGIYIDSNCTINVSGNIMSLLYGDNFADKTEFPVDSTWSFGYLFRNNTNLINAEHLILHATTLTKYCYAYMFKDCTSLSTAPELPTTTLAFGCYYGMFFRCTALTTAPALPTTTLASGCYANMFQGCTSLITAPELPATTLAGNCYQFMFQGCTSLNSITMLATDISASNCLTSWVQGVSSTGTFTKSPAMTSLPTGANGIPEGWTVVDYGAA